MSLNCARSSMSSQIADETQKKGKRGERAQNIFPQETSFGNLNLSAFAILSVRLEADAQGIKQPNRGTGFLNQ